MSASLSGLLTCDVVVEGGEYPMIIDTGASQCLMTKGYYDTLPDKIKARGLRPTRHCFTTASGATLPALGVFDLPIHIDGKKLVERFFVSDTSACICLLGMSFLRYRKVQIDADSLTMSFKGERHVIQLAKRRTLGGFFLRSRNRIIIPSHSYVCVLADIDSAEFVAKLQNRPVICTGSMDLWDKSGVDSVDGYYRVRNGKTKLILHNPSNHPVRISKGFLIGQAEICDKGLAIGDMYQDKVNQELMEEYARQYKRTLLDECNFLALVLTKEEKELFRLVGEDPPDDLSEDEADVRNGNDNDEMCCPIPVKGGKPTPAGEFKPHMVKMIKEELTDNENLSVGDKRKLKEYFLASQDHFYDPTVAISQTEFYEHAIDTGDHRPIAVRPRRVPMAMKKTVDKEIEDMLEAKVISPSDSPWASPIVLVKKKDGTIRFCVDYREVNLITRKDKYPLPLIEDYLDKFHGMKYFCTLDLASGYWQLKMCGMDKCKTAFTSHKGLYQFNVMPFGLCNAPATFQRMMDNLLGAHKDKCLVYLDDIIIMGKTMEECISNLKVVMRIIKKAGLKLKAKKCSFFKTKVNFLGHVVSGGCISTDPDKIAKVKNWPMPQRVGHVRSFLGLACYYQRFIKDFADIARPLTKIIGSKSVFTFGESQMEAFEKLKLALTEAPVLSCPKPDARFILDTDASKVAIGAVLSQVQEGVEKVIAYGSKTLNSSQVNYCTTKRELYAVVYFATAKFRDYLSLTEFTVRTDHQPLMWLRNFSGTCMLTNRWSILLNQFGPDMKIEHRAGVKHANADSLSRSASRICKYPSCVDCKDRRKDDTNKPRAGVSEYNTICQSTGTYVGNSKRGGVDVVSSPNHPEQVGNAMTVNDAVEWKWECPLYTEDEVREAQNEDLTVSRIVELLKLHPVSKPPPDTLHCESKEVKAMCAAWDDYYLEDETLYKRASKKYPERRLVAPDAFMVTIMDQLHNRPTAGHPGMSKTYASVKKRFYWLGMKADITRWVKCCRICATHKRGPRRSKHPLTQEISGSRNERVAFDVIGPLPETRNGNRFILLMVDYFTKWVEVAALPNHTAKTVASELLTRWVTRFGVPYRLHCDQAPEFKSAVMQEFTKLISTCKTQTAPYRPQSNGLAERSNQTIEGILRCLVNGNRAGWDEHLQLAAMAYRATEHTSTGASPNLMVFGQENFMPIDLMFRPPGVGRRDGTREGCVCDYIIWLRDSIQAAYARARECLKAAARRQRRTHDIDIRTVDFKPGDWVLHWHKPTAAKTLSQGWRKPLVIIRKYSSKNYSVQESPETKPHKVHVDYLVRDPVNPYRGNWIKDEEAARAVREAAGKAQMEDAVGGIEQLEEQEELLQDFSEEGNDEVVIDPEILEVQQVEAIVGPGKKQVGGGILNGPLEKLQVSKPPLVNVRRSGRKTRMVDRYGGVALCVTHEPRHVLDHEGQCPGVGNVLEIPEGGEVHMLLSTRGCRHVRGF
jgi:hypothetical protein